MHQYITEDATQHPPTPPTKEREREREVRTEISRSKGENYTQYV